MSATVYVDESGDLGWTLDKPYLNGGSSRYLTIAAVVTPGDCSHLPARVVRDLYTKQGWPPQSEKKWTAMSDAARVRFADQAVKLVERNPQIKLFAMTVNKVNVDQHLRADSNLLYNYMLRLLLLDELAKHDEVTLIPDPRTIKVASGNSQHEYLQTTLWYDMHAKTKLHSKPVDSKKELGIQFADMLSGAAQSHQERKKSDPWKRPCHAVKWKTLFF